ncbi:putative vacuolar sorting-associated protein 13B [Cucumis melo var. makuwa]|uniref:Vacuolar sorting-associated protein 13B n=1 Tax=Cucumis melo var. makuwa TaxID=1194695 RepID=A0A5A7V1N5_CUCMM|nr:putative vacuolar sorting-associated protein 13B [Cucumis melo var. makuwa]TYK10821.1 putative vacuolar sorting-associated protein 13B [Cucumis melo var. makuwa]
MEPSGNSLNLINPAVKEPPLLASTEQSHPSQQKDPDILAVCSTKTQSSDCFNRLPSSFTNSSEKHLAKALHSPFNVSNEESVGILSAFDHKINAENEGENLTALFDEVVFPPIKVPSDLPKDMLSLVNDCSRDIGWDFVESVGSSGGILTIWDDSSISVIEASAPILGLSKTSSNSKDSKMEPNESDGTMDSSIERVFLTGSLDELKFPKNTEDGIVKSLLGKGRSRVVFNLELKLSCAQIFLVKENESNLASLLQENLLANIKVFLSSFSIEGTLGNLRISDDSLSSSHMYYWACDMRNPGGVSFVELFFSSFNFDEEDYISYEYNLLGNLSECLLHL